jgi:HSP20 family protein
MTIMKWNRGRQTPSVYSDRDLSTMFPSLFTRPFATRDLMQDFFGGMDFGVAAKNFPAVNISETENDIMIEVAAPGMKKQDFKIEIDGDQLHISYKKEDKTENNPANHLRKEFSHESFERAFTLPTMVEKDKIAASYTDGILKISVPKKEEAKKSAARTIEIQ